MVVLEPLEGLDSEFDAIAPRDGAAGGWGALGVGVEDVPDMLVTPEEASEWWDGKVLRLAPRAAVVHGVDAPLRAGERLMLSANVRLADADANAGQLGVVMLNRNETMNRTVAAPPVPVGGKWRRVFVELNLGSSWPAAGESNLQLVNSGGGEVLIDKIALARIGTDASGFRTLFNGADLEGWTGNREGYGVERGAIRTYPDRAGGNLYTEDEFDDFILRFAFKVPPGANNGIAVRAPLTGDAAYDGLEIQVLENSHPKYQGLKPWQVHGSIYGLAAALRGYQAPPGEWNHQEIRVEGRKVRVVLNGKVINEVDLDEALRKGPPSGREHPGAKRTSGHIGFCGHGDVVHFTDLRVRPLSETQAGSER